jgi:LysR family transcriptional regulator, hydrogen peroxide-inducible genes activator
MGFDLGPIDLNLLYTFHVFVESGGVGLAGRRLGRSQPAVSARLHQLEGELGVRLFDRVGRRLELTAVGRAVDREARSVLAGAQRVLDLARSSDSEPIGTLRIGSLPTLAVHLLTPIVARFVKTHPRADVHLDLAGPMEHLTQLSEGRLDLVVSLGRPPPGRFEVLRLGEVSPVLVTPRKAALPEGKARLATLRALSYVGYGRTGDTFFDTVWEFLERYDLDRRVRLRVAHISMIKALIAEGAGASILPDYTVTEASLATRSIEKLAFSQPVWAAFRASTGSVVLLERFTRALADARAATRRSDRAGSSRRE